MRNFQEKKSFRRFLESKWVLIVLFILLLLFLWNILNFLNKRDETEKNLNIVKNKILELEASKDSLRAEIDNLSTEKGVEASIREKYGLVKEGEQVIVVVDDKNALPTVEENNSVFTKIKNWFKQ